MSIKPVVNKIPFETYYVLWYVLPVYYTTKFYIVRQFS